jgi:CheY-like chemotaxis protein
MNHFVLIEDDPNSARLAERLLLRAGHTVAVADDAETGLALIADRAPDVLLVDLGLPDIDGQTVIALLRQNPDTRHIPIVVLTAWPEDTAAAMVESYGCAGLIRKPIDTRAFMNQIAGFIPFLKSGADVPD